ncbi:hypothetical protein NDU88_005806 [Pleurodeles waltl]|uniref:Uncharacterized protein n=1 Tax=Pleurodeles waltl TaxID=8319 RepID=A0AAV7UJ68_PLEWA|nr:hypothetical protein NDU88_005806 [Pleurodeles waltl]
MPLGASKITLHVRVCIIKGLRWVDITHKRDLAPFLLQSSQRASFLLSAGERYVDLNRTLGSRQALRRFCTRIDVCVGNPAARLSKNQAAQVAISPAFVSDAAHHFSSDGRRSSGRVAGKHRFSATKPAAR